ncbi:MAG: DEAD/DEAH box helicase family protein [Armatimonadota bacterium]|nr:DEAD/DEAH box helicase family protein [Armatimonadota bacterium]
MLQLKEYQQRALDKLREYLHLAESTNDVDLAFYQLTHAPYRRVEQIEGPPYICLRVPTGGGKTLMACHAVAIAAQDFLRQERCVVLWLVPTNTIKDQTLAALRNRSHPYRQALDAALGRVQVMDVEEALYLTRPTLDSESVIIVSTLAAPRIGDTDKRKLYDQNGALMGHFDGFPPEALAKLEKYNGSDQPIPSLANVLCLRMPIVVMDEAHNARTPLSFETLARFDPSCILEFTATPAIEPPNPSNVLCRVSAWELKSEDMIKLPIRLETSSDWRQTILAASQKRDELEKAAEAERADGGAYLRPIVLLQAQKKNEEITVETVYNCLKDEMRIPEARIAVETGDRQDLSGVDVFADTCPVRYIITVDKLREGWDCAFAYVLCSVRDTSSKTAVEQILGRVLRMPSATRKNRPELNQAYAFVTSHQFADTASTLDALKGALEANGFTPPEAEQAIYPALPTSDWGYGGLFKQETGPTPSERGEKFAVPQLALWIDGELEPVEQSHFLRAQWQLAECDPLLGEAEYAPHGIVPQLYEIDVTKDGAVQSWHVSDLQQRLAVVVPCDINTPERLALWLDRMILHPDVVQTQSLLFLTRVVKGLLQDRGIPLEDLIRERLRLRDAAALKIDGYRREAMKAGFDQILLGVYKKDVEVSAERVFRYDPDRYPLGQPYNGGIGFKKHYYRNIGDMNGEEERCAQVIDFLPNVKYWVRNIERSDMSFWLQTSTDKFYPDFVALLDDDRVLAVEYKGGLHIKEDTEEKTDLGALWEAKSNGKCVFRMVFKENFVQKLQALGGNA